jgi:hypothetical protein
VADAVQASPPVFTEDEHWRVSLFLLLIIPDSVWEEEDSDDDGN